LNKKSERQPVVTGVGWTTPFGIGGMESLTGLISGASSIAARTVQCSAAPLFQALTQEVLATGGELSKELEADHGTWLAGATVLAALHDAKWELDRESSDRMGLALGCGSAGQEAMIAFATEVREQSPRFVSPLHFPQTVGNYAAGAIARALHFRGPNLTFAGGTGCGMAAIIEACRLLQRGEAEVMLAGGFEAYTDALAGAFGEGRENLSEGACFLVLEIASHAEGRNAPRLATVNGWCHGPDTEEMIRKAEVVSVVDGRRPGAVCAEEFIGRCDGALGAAAVAAGIASVRGPSVTIMDEQGGPCAKRRATLSTPPSSAAVEPRLAVVSGQSTADRLAMDLFVHA